MIGTVHVYDATTGALLALGTTDDAHPARCAAEFGWFRTTGTVLIQPSEFHAELALYRELDFHEGQQRFPSPRWN